VKYCDPNNPSSSPVCETKINERLGFTFAPAKRLGDLQQRTVPEPSSSAAVEDRIATRRMQAMQTVSFYVNLLNQVGCHLVIGRSQLEFSDRVIDPRIES